MSYKTALENFLADRETLASTVIEHTTATQHGGFINIELYKDGTVGLRNENDKSDPTGVVIGLSFIADEDLADLQQVAGSSAEEDLAEELCGDSSWLLDSIIEELQKIGNNAIAEEEKLSRKV